MTAVTVTLTKADRSVVLRGGTTTPVSLGAARIQLKVSRSGRLGPPGPEGPQGPQGIPGDGATDPGDLVVLFENKLI